MILDFNFSLGKGYKSNSQIARVLTESWVKGNSYCPSCGEEFLKEFENNMPVADFYCVNCSEEYELKSKKGSSIGNKIVDGAYSSMIERINSETNPNFFFLTYDNIKWKVNNFLIIPKHFFISDIIEKRNPLSNSAKRAGWVGCNIDLKKVPKSGRIFLIKDSKIVPKDEVRNEWEETIFIKNKNQISRGWIIDILNCIEKIDKNVFSLDEIYSFENQLKLKHPNNNFVKDKIRQQLQILRDKGFIEFKSKGIYKKIKI